MSRWRMFMCTGMVIMAMAVTSAPAAAESNRGKGSGKGSGNSGKQGGDKGSKLDLALSDRTSKPGWSRVIVTLQPGADARADVKKLGGKHLRNLRLMNGQVIELPNGQLKQLAKRSDVVRIDWDRPTAGPLPQGSKGVAAPGVQRSFGYTGAGVGVAVIDSGVTEWHDDLSYAGSNRKVKVVGNQRVSAFVDFVNGSMTPYDDHGHGTHVTGIIAGNGYDSVGNHAGIAPAAHIVSLKVLDAHGRGVISDVIAALEYAVANRAAHNIRVINLSVGAAVTTSYNTDPLALAAKRAVDAGIVVVTASGNLGRAPDGGPQYGGITAPGNAPWVLTVGASDHRNTLSRTDDIVAAFSSRGPTAIDFAAKPDLVAPGTGIVSLSAPGSSLYNAKKQNLLDGALGTSSKPYLSLSGTSMAAPAVSGTVALMLEANPSLTPNLVKALLQYTAQVQPNVDYMTQGGGFLNARGAVEMARFFWTAKVGSRYPHDTSWARKITWGNRRIGRGVLNPSANAWAIGTVWGSVYDTAGDNVVWGTACETETCTNVRWGTTFDGSVTGSFKDDGDNVVWGTFEADGDNVVWGTVALDGDNVVWGTFVLDGDNVVWGTACGVEDCSNVVWGTFDISGDNVVWGTFDISGDNVVWGTSGEVSPDVWAGAGNDATWGVSSDDVLFVYPASFILLLEAELSVTEPVLEPVTLVEPVTNLGGGIL